MRGKISQWKDDKGFGFIIPEDGTDKLFFHITSVKTCNRRPQIGDTVLYESMVDSQNRLKAKSVVIEGVIPLPGSQNNSRFILTKPPQKNALDYSLIFILLGSLVAAGFNFIKTESIESSILYGIPALVAFLLLNRAKKPKEKKFSCARCKIVAEHDARTITAWNKGFLKLYCSSCHRKWLDDNPTQQYTSAYSRGGGCLGVLAILVIVPIISGVLLYQWFV
jgi:cold shock CspA family protein